MISLIMLLLADACFIIFLLQSLRRTRYLYHIHSIGERCEGTIIDIVETEDAENNMFYDPLIEITVNNEIYRFSPDHTDSRRAQIGEVVNVRYFKDDPSTAIVEPGDQLTRMIIMIAVCLVIFLVIDWMWLTAIINNYL